MPGIAGIICKEPYAGIEGDLHLMVEAMRHEKFYRGGEYVNKELGLYVGWMAHEGSFADCMPLVIRSENVVLIFEGEHYFDSAAVATNGHHAARADEGTARNLVRLYEENEKDFFSRLNGWFCGVLVDLRNR